MLMATLYFASTRLLVAGAMAIDRGSAAVKMWRRNLPAVSINYLVGCFIALFVVTYIDEINVAVLGIVIPVLLISYLTLQDLDRSTRGRQSARSVR